MKELLYGVARVLLMPLAIMARRRVARMLLAALSRDQRVVFPLKAGVFFLGEEERAGRSRATYLVLVTDPDERSLTRYRCTIIEERGRERVETARTDNAALDTGEAYQIEAQAVTRFHVIDGMSWREI